LVYQKPWVKAERVEISSKLNVGAA